jgi:hypothetical protein
MKKSLLIPPQQLSFSFDIANDPVVLIESKNKIKLDHSKINLSAKVVNFNQALIARKVNKDSLMYLRILESVKHIA